jgi:hypothetical protein
MNDDDEDARATIECETHGSSPGSIVCCHLLRPSDASLGFVENSSDPDDLQAWCDACEQLFLREGELTEAFREFCNFAVVCVGCYARIKQLHSSPN